MKLKERRNATSSSYYAPYSSSKPDIQNKLRERFIIGIVMATALVFLNTMELPEGSVWITICTIMRGIGGHFCYALSFIPCLFATLDDHNEHKAYLYLLLILAFFASVHVFFARRIVVERMTINGFSNFVAKSYSFGKGGGVIGALLAWPLYRYFGEIGGFIAAVLIMLVCLFIAGDLGKIISFLSNYINRHKQMQKIGQESSKLSKDVLKDIDDSKHKFKLDHPTPVEPIDTKDIHMNGDQKIMTERCENMDDVVPFGLPERKTIKIEELSKIDFKEPMVEEDMPEYNYPPIDLLESGSEEDGCQKRCGR